MEYKVILFYNGIENILQCKKEDTMKEIFRKYKNKVDINYKEVYFLYGGNNIDLELTYEQTINKDDLERGEMKILLYNKTNINEDNSQIKSKYVICPECKENCFLNLQNYKISLSGCKKGHKIDNILLNEFEQTQIINESKIKCDKCMKKTKNNSYNNQFYKCFTCQQNFCPLCKSLHDKNHIIIDYDKKDYICNIHNETFISYCKDCKINLCMQCEESHNNHIVIEYRSLIPKKANIEGALKELNNINKIKEIINKMINILKEIKENIAIYYKIHLDIINNYDVYNRNYQIFQNINEIIRNINKNNFNDIINEDNIKNQFNSLLDIYKKMTDKNNSTFEDENSKMKNSYHKNDKKINNIEKMSTIDNIITIKYKIDKDNIKIFGKEFVDNNKNNCIIEYKEKEDELKENFVVSKCNKKVDILEIKLKIINKINDFSDMFFNCKSLLSLPDIANLDTSNVIKMNGMFRGCSSLKYLSDISKWDTSKVTDMNGMFNGCKSLESIPDISKWDTSNVTNMAWMFSDCKLLKSIPDISKWNIGNVINMDCMFDGCKNLQNIPHKFKN